MIYSYNHIAIEDKKPAEPGDKDVFYITDEDVFFAKERYNLHQSSPEEGVDADILKQYFSKKYGF